MFKELQKAIIHATKAVSGTVKNAWAYITFSTARTITALVIATVVVGTTTTLVCFGITNGNASKPITLITTSSQGIPDDPNPDSAMGTVSEDTASQTVEADGITLDQSALSLDVGNGIQLQATVAPDDTTDKTVTWSSANDGIATVDGNGVVRGVSAGTVNITATCGNANALCVVTITVPKTEDAASSQSADNGNTAASSSKSSASTSSKSTTSKSSSSSSSKSSGSTTTTTTTPAKVTYTYNKTLSDQLTDLDGENLNHSSYFNNFYQDCLTVAEGKISLEDMCNTKYGAKVLYTNEYGDFGVNNWAEADCTSTATDAQSLYADAKSKDLFNNHMSGGPGITITFGYYPEYANTDPVFKHDYVLDGSDGTKKCVRIILDVAKPY